MKRLFAAALFVAVGTSLAFAGPISERQTLMKGVGEATKKGVAIAKGEAPFDEAQVKEILRVYLNASAKVPTLFPNDTKTGRDDKTDHDTSAGPKIWEDPAGFKAAAAKLGADAQAAMTANDQTSFAAAFGEVTKNCNACHGTFRLKKS
jgi:cytochrome c556